MEKIDLLAIQVMKVVKIYTDYEFSYQYLLLLTILIIIPIYLLKWRKTIIDKQISIVPSKLFSKLFSKFKKNPSDFSALSERLDKFEKSISKSKKENSEIVKELKEYLSILTKSTSKKDEEIIRLREGYDMKIFKGFLNRFFRAYRMIEEDLEFYTDKDTDENNESCITLLNNLKQTLKESFLDCGLEEFSPQKGEEYKKAFGVSENIVNIETTVESENMKIAKIKSSGFKLKNYYNDRYEVIKPAIVAVYKLKKKG